MDRHEACRFAGGIRQRYLLVEGPAELDDAEDECKQERQHECELDGCRSSLTSGDDVVTIFKGMQLDIGAPPLIASSRAERNSVGLVRFNK